MAVKVLLGDARQTLRDLPAGLAQACIPSTPKSALEVTMKSVLDDTPWGVAHAWATKQELARLEREHEVQLALRAAQARKCEARRLRDQKKRSG